MRTALHIIGILMALALIPTGLAGFSDGSDGGRFFGAWALALAIAIGLANGVVHKKNVRKDHDPAGVYGDFVEATAILAVFGIALMASKLLINESGFDQFLEDNTLIDSLLILVLLNSLVKFLMVIFKSY